LRSTSDTVARDTPQAAAMSDTVTRLSAGDDGTAIRPVQKAAHPAPL
jgi:hypothetical protein